MLGALETDTGDVARRLGDEATFQQLARALIHTLDGLDFQRIVTADPHVLHCLRNEYPRWADAIVEHHSATLAALARAGSIRLKPLESSAPLTYHDPATWPATTVKPRRRALLARLGAPLRK